jgi:uncharacterized protein
MTRLSAICIYPIKSLRGINLDSAIVTGGRLNGDREWMLVDEQGRVMHQGDYPQMARLSVARTSFGVFVESDSAGLLSLPAAVETREPREIEYVRLLRRSAPVTHVSNEADAWFSAALSVPGVRLMAFVRNRTAIDPQLYETSSSLHDATPFHLTSEDSLGDLNGRMRTPVPMNRFRPNLVVRGAEPYSEDAWVRFAIGEMTFQWIKPCTRCAITTTDQITGARPTREPLRTLASYRRVGNEVVFGHYFVALRPHGPLRVGEGLVLHESVAGAD